MLFSLHGLATVSTDLLMNMFNIYLYLIGTVFVCGVALILCDRDWQMVEELYLNMVKWVQDQLIKLHEMHLTGHSFRRSNNSSNYFADADPFGALGDCHQQQRTWPDNARQSPPGRPAFDTDNVFNECSSTESSHSDAEDEHSFELLQLPPHSSPANFAPFELSSELCAQAIQSIANDGVGAGFRLSPDYCRYELKMLWRLHISGHYSFRRLIRRFFRMPDRSVHQQQQHNVDNSSDQHQPRHDHAHVGQPHYCRDGRPLLRHANPSADAASTERRLLRLLLLSSLAFRFCALFPLRLAFLLASFVHLFVCCACDICRPLPPLVKTRCAVIYCRLYSTGCGFITRYQGTEHRPKRAGVICSNHLSPNDVQVIFGDIPAKQDYLYMVTGQKHRGFIWVLENLVDKVCPAIWLERADTESRRQFSIQVLEAAKNSGPVILFPEGYCTNNSMVLMFRRAVFQDDVTVYPVAIRQEARFGDAYWSEDNFMHYLFRVMTSWAIVYNVHYLAPQHRRPNENATEFAARVQRLIATRVGVRPIAYDGGGIWYKPTDRQKAHFEWQKRCASKLEELLSTEVVSTTGTEEEEGEGKEQLIVRSISSDGAEEEGTFVAEPSKHDEEQLQQHEQQKSATAVAAVTQKRREERRRRMSQSVESVVDDVVGAAVGEDSDEMDLIG
ncbi:hypothetical protein niasHS_001512 [Heterodera schachtii]|uniref:Phospholipid/glycerol acyltransferase domain-containing protein n=1 Tax=Heterodera schachtii TaxID=97005 RepID=A0ABD2KDZ8_HETSC